MISWEELNDKYHDIAGYDRMLVREIPNLLAGVGLQVIRNNAAASASPVPQPMPA